jgi:hypothetical protein
MEAEGRILVASLTGMESPMEVARVLKISQRVEIAAACLVEVRLKLPVQPKLRVLLKLPAQLKRQMLLKQPEPLHKRLALPPPLDMQLKPLQKLLRLVKLNPLKHNLPKKLNQRKFPNLILPSPLILRTPVTKIRPLKTLIHQIQETTQAIVRIRE